MSRSTVFWDTRCLLTRFACRKSVGQATSRRSAGDGSTRTFRPDIVFWPRLREKPKKLSAARNSRRLFVADRRVNRPDRSTPRIKRSGSETPIRVSSPRRLQSIRILNRSDEIDSDHSLDASEFLRLSYGPWPRTWTIRPFSKFSCWNGSTAPGTWPDFTSCRSNRRSSRTWRLCAGGVASGAGGESGSTCTRPGGSHRSSSRNGSIARGAADTSSGPDRRRQYGPVGRPNGPPLGFSTARWRHYHSLALPPLGLSDFDLWILGYEFLRHERDSHSPTRMNLKHPAEFGE